MEWVLLAVLVSVAILIATMASRGRRLTELMTRFRSRNHTVDATAAERGPADAKQHMARRRAAVDLWPQALPPVAQARYSERWRRIQLRFVYEPAGAVREADGLVDEALRQLGYEPGDLDPRNGRVPVPPGLLADYLARSFQRAGQSEADVARLREAFVRDRALFDQLVAATTADGPRLERRDT